MYTIIGSGFGLYGYLPALVEGIEERVVLPRAYASKVRARPELADTLPNIRWVDDEAAALSLATAVVVATPPQRQFDVASGCLMSPHIKKLVLEKPLAVTPSLAAELIVKLDDANKRYRIGYSLLNTAWHQSLAWPKLSTPTASILINWTFMAHHFAWRVITWKRVHAEGGGVLRFYGIHLVALLAQKGYDAVHNSVLGGENPGEPERWQAVFAGSGLPDCHVHVDSRSAMRQFEIVHRMGGRDDVILGLADPFEAEISKGGGDARVGVLKRLLDTFQADDRPFHLFYERVNTLWQKTEGA